MSKQFEHPQSKTQTSESVPDAQNDDPAKPLRGKGKQPKSKKKKCTCRGFSNNEVDDDRKKRNYEGKSWFREKKVWQEFIRRHRKDLKNAQPVVDDKPPKLNVSNIYDLEILSVIRQNLKGAFDLNQLMVKSLHEVNVLPGKTDTFTFNYKKPQYTNYPERREAVKMIERQNVLMSKIIKNPQTRMTTAKEYAEEWKKNEMVMENSSQFPLFWKVKKEKESAIDMAPPVPYFRQYVTEKSARYSDKRPRVFFEVSIANVGVVGRMVAVLYSDYVPMTVKNFLAFCDPKASLTYKGNLFYLIFQNYYCQTGDVVENRGYGGTSIYGPYFGNEDFTLRHGERGILTMYQKIPNRNESQFLITFRKLESLDGVNVVFGKITKGFHVLDAIESVGSKKTGRPKVDIYISDCDEL